MLLASEHIYLSSERCFEDLRQFFKNQSKAIAKVTNPYIKSKKIKKIKKYRGAGWPGCSHTCLVGFVCHDKGVIVIKCS
jgi:hypothetical protein